MEQRSSKKRTILAVDDKLENLKVLIKYLENSGYELMVAQSGEETFKHIERIVPDIILLDVLMPGIDGFETCRRLKENEATKDIPVLFMTALTDTVDKVRGFEVGAVDYLTKPLQHEEVLARVNAQMTIRIFQQQLQEQNDQLREFTDKINADIERARLIQQQFLPAQHKMPYPDKIDWAYSFEPAEEVGGDYFDVGIVDENRIAILFSDVCGHGMSAAFLTAVLKTTFQDWLDKNSTLKELAINLNANLYRLTPIDSFAGVFLLIYNRTSGTCQYLNFGHHPEPWLIPGEKKQAINQLTNARSLPMGFMEKIEYPFAEFTLTAGDSMLFVSDGIVENKNPHGQPYDMKCFESLLERKRSLPVVTLVNDIKTNSKDCADSPDQLDDCTVLAFRILE